MCKNATSYFLLVIQNSSNVRNEAYSPIYIYKVFKYRPSKCQFVAYKSFGVCLTNVINFSRVLTKFILNLRKKKNQTRLHNDYTNKREREYWTVVSYFENSRLRLQTHQNIK